MYSLVHNIAHSRKDWTAERFSCHEGVGRETGRLGEEFGRTSSSLHECAEADIRAFSQGRQIGGAFRSHRYRGIIGVLEGGHGRTTGGEHRARGRPALPAIP